MNCINRANEIEESVILFKNTMQKKKNEKKKVNFANKAPKKRVYIHTCIYILRLNLLL